MVLSEGLGELAFMFHVGQAIQESAYISLLINNVLFRYYIDLFGVKIITLLVNQSITDGIELTLSKV